MEFLNSEPYYASKKIVNQSSDFQVRRTGSYRHKKSTGCDNKLQCHGSAYRSHSDLVVDVLFCDVLLAETGILSIAFCETVDICGVQCVPCLLSSAVVTEHFLSTVFLHHVLSGSDGNNYCLQCFDAVGWAAGRASGL